MKKIQVVALSAVVALGAFFTSCEGNMTTNVPLKSEVDSLSYAFGGAYYEQALSSILSRQGIITDTTTLKMSYMSMINAETDEQKKTALQKELKSKMDSIANANQKNLAAFLKGLNEAFNAPQSQSAYFAGIQWGGELSKQVEGLTEYAYGPDSSEKLNKSAIMAAILSSAKKQKLAIAEPSIEFNMMMEKKQAEKMKDQYKDNLEAGEKFLAENKTKEGVVTLPSGLQYKVIKEGNGPKPTASDIVEVHYHGTLIDGTVFDSSVDRNKTQTFGVSGVIKGWIEALQLMPVGSKWTLYVPQELAYGSQDRGTIKPFSALVFDVELLDIKKSDAQAPAAAK